MRPFSRIRIDTEILLRGLAIAAVVLNHAQTGTEDGGLGYGGGMNFLMALSGYNLARFGLHERSARQFQTSCWRLAVGIAVPSWAILLLNSMVKPVGPEYWLFYSNWITWWHPGMLHIWYVEVVLQILLALAVLFRIGAIARAFSDHPLLSSLILFVLAIELHLLLAGTWDPEELRGRLPHMFLWNFVLGMLTYFALNEPSRVSRWWRVMLVLACAVGGAALAYGPGKLNFWWLSCAMAAWVWVPRITLPAVVARAMQVTSQAAFTIFLCHAAFLWAFRVLHVPGGTAGHFTGAFAGSLLIWLVGTSAIRAYRAIGGPPPRIWTATMALTARLRIAIKTHPHLAALGRSQQAKRGVSESSLTSPV